MRCTSVNVIPSQSAFSSEREGLQGFFFPVDRGAARRKRRGEDSAVGGRDPGEGQGSAAGPRPQPGAEARGNQGLGGRHRRPVLR